MVLDPETAIGDPGLQSYLYFTCREVHIFISDAQWLLAGFCI